MAAKDIMLQASTISCSKIGRYNEEQVCAQRDYNISGYPTLPPKTAISGVKSGRKANAKNTL